MRQHRRRTFTTSVGLSLVMVIVAGVSGSVAFALGSDRTVTNSQTDYVAALTARLSSEYRDDALGSEVVAGFDAEFLANLEARVPLTEVATAPFLAYRPTRVPARRVDSVIVFAFGNRVAADGTVEPGPANEALSAATKKFVAKHKVPVYAQTEIAEILVAEGVKRVTSIDPEVAADGTVVYLSTVGVADAVLAKAAAAGVGLGTVGIIGFADHVMRCVLTAEAAGMTAAVPKGVRLPSTYDPESSQPWTRSRTAFLPVDLVGRLTIP